MAHDPYLAAALRVWIIVVILQFGDVRADFLPLPLSSHVAELGGVLVDFIAQRQGHRAA
jgi:hypothetical protein